MRFFADGPDIPDDLLNLRDDGRVVFFCGAGVSMGRAGLPSFTGLARKVLQSLGSQRDSDEQKLLDAMGQLGAQGLGGAVSADRVFSFLEKSFDSDDIANAVATALRPSEDADLGAHRTILRLCSQGEDGPRLITSNFDRLFEQCDPRASSHTRSSLPRVSLGSSDWGIVHLHGCVSADLNAPGPDGFVLSSAEFGDAYLANGWARDFVREVLDAYAAVFIGYTADDPPMRYLLEGLRKADGPTPRLFAFQDGPEDEAIARWDDKGVVAIAYTVDSGDYNHRRLYATLDAWADRAADPARWRSKVFRRGRTSPAALQPHERGMVAHIAKTRRGAIAFRNHAPNMSPEWLCVFDPHIRFGKPRERGGPFSETPVVDPFGQYCLDSDPLPAEDNKEFVRRERVPADVWDAFATNAQDRQELDDAHIANLRSPPARRQPLLPPRVSAIAEWIALNAHHPATVWWAAQQATLHPELLDRVRNEVNRSGKRMRKVVREAWRQLFDVLNRNSLGDRSFELFKAEASLAAHDWGPSAVREYAKAYQVDLKRVSFHRRPSPPNWQETITVADLIAVRVDFADGDPTPNVPDRAVKDIVRAIRPCIEEAIDLNSEYGGRLQVASFIPADTDDDDDDFDRQYGISGYVQAFSTLYRRLVDIDAAAARQEFRVWRRSDHVFRRLRYWAAGFPSVASADEFADEVIELPIADFWRSDAQRDLMLPLASRWSDISGNRKLAIEEILRAGPPRSGVWDG